MDHIVFYHARSSVVINPGRLSEGEQAIQLSADITSVSQSSAEFQDSIGQILHNLDFPICNVADSELPSTRQTVTNQQSEDGGRQYEGLDLKGRVQVFVAYRTQKDEPRISEDLKYTCSLKEHSVLHRDYICTGQHTPKRTTNKVKHPGFPELGKFLPEMSTHRDL